MPETSLSGRSTRTARNVRKLNEVFLLILIVAKLNRYKKKILNEYFPSSFFLYPVTTTTKSMAFQGLRRYEPRCNTNPNAIIFKADSKQNIPIK